MTVGDDARTRLIAVLVAAEHQRANGDGLIHVALSAKITNGAAVETTPDRLELINDLHRTHLRRSDQRARWERSGKQIERITTRRKLAAHTTDHMHDMAVTLDGFVGRHVHATGFGDTPQIISCQVNEHDVLGVFFWIGEQVDFVLAIDDIIC